MATRSTIAVETQDGRIQQVYCHWDGYLDNNGKILIEHYKDWSKAIALVAMGDLSSLRKELGKKHDFDARYDADDERKQWTTFYGRDRGETGCEAKTFENFEVYRQNHQYEEYEYVMRSNGEWFVSEYSGPYVPLADAIAAEMMNKEMEVDDE